MLSVRVLGLLIDGVNGVLNQIPLLSLQKL
jgi:hypothetical protein